MGEWLYALDAISGRRLWHWQMDRDSDPQPVVADGLVHIGGDALYSLDLVTGRLVRKVEVDHRGDILGSPKSLSADRGVLFFGDHLFRKVLAVPTRS
jgi:hypothetical protein